MTEKQKYLFICGCPRSGTSALVDLVNFHPLISIGMERYKYYVNKENIHKINPQAFNYEYFFDIKDEQTNIKWERIYEKLSQKYKLGNKLTLGDKYPHYYEFYNEINKQFQDVKWIFIIRDILDVALSYNARAYNPKDKWPKEANYKKAVAHWNSSLIKTWKYLKDCKAPNLFICEYEQLFSYNKDYFDSLVSFLEVDNFPELEVFYHQTTKHWHKRQNRKAKEIEKEQLEYIDSKANIKLKKHLLHFTS